MDAVRFDLEERLLEFATAVIQFVRTLEKSDAGRHVAGQLLRSGTAPLGHHGEAQAAESPRDFVHKMKIGLKELRESIRWIKLCQRVPLSNEVELNQNLLRECDELSRIFAASVRTATRNQLQPTAKPKP
jgi:four helix bundle protein